MMVKLSLAYRVVIVLLALTTLTTTALPMTNDAIDQLVALDSVEHHSQQQEHETPHILKIAPKKQREQQQQLTEIESPTTDNDDNHQPSGVYDTIIEQLRAAGVHTSETKDLQTLSYKQLTRLLALWHLTQQRNYYEATEDGNQSAGPSMPDKSNDNNSNDKVNTQK